MSRIVCQFSCGAASAAATKPVLAEFGATREILIVNAFIQEEHEDNRRFPADCEKWFDREITVLRDEKYGASTLEVFRRKRYLKGQREAPCSKQLKRDLLDSFRQTGDAMVLGYTVEEQNRYDDFIDRNNGIDLMVPLIDRGLTKGDCLGMLERAGIEMPAMYRMGCVNANCIGCVEGGLGYWNKIRRDFPERFEEIAVIEETIGPSAYLFRDRDTNERFSLRHLDPSAGRHDEPLPACSYFCEIAEQEIA